jgi:glycosyltransferase involved in cell wall biosynthesis
VRITVVIPSIPGRRKMLARALASVAAQSHPAHEVVVEKDVQQNGATVTRQRGLEKVETEWVAFLDDDDEFKPDHLRLLAGAVYVQDADYVYPWYDIVGGRDPMAQFFGKPWDPAQPHQTTITTLVRTELAQSVGFTNKPSKDPNGGSRLVGGEDYRFTLACNEAGARIFHLPMRTWRWHHHGRNTSGLARNR